MADQPIPEPAPILPAITDPEIPFGTEHSGEAQVVEVGPFHVSNTSDGKATWFSARDPASGVTIPAKSREDAYDLVSSLNRAVALHVRMALATPTSSPSSEMLAEAVRIFEEIAARPTHEGGCYYNNRLSIFAARDFLKKIKESGNG